MEENAIPQAPDMNTLKEFHHHFSEVTQIKDAAENVQLPKLISEGEITTLRTLKNGQKIISKKLFMLKNFFCLYMCNSSAACYPSLGS
jgi:hypothetical protein